MRSILLHVHDDDCLEARLQISLDLCRVFDGHLTCLQPVTSAFIVPDALYGTADAKIVAQSRESEDRLREKLEQRLSGEDVRWDWLRSEGAASAQIARHAPLYDLLVLGAHNPAGKDKAPSTLFSELVLDVRAPVLITPATAKGIKLDGPAIVAWNSSAESAHALRAAMPMLARSTEVHVLSVREAKDEALHDLPSTGAPKYLARHGIEANISELQADNGLSIADALRSAAQARKGAYMVMGAYGHSRLRERILGGVTRDMLSAPKIPLLLCH